MHDTAGVSQRNGLGFGTAGGEGRKLLSCSSDGHQVTLARGRKRWWFVSCGPLYGSPMEHQDSMIL